MKNSPKIDYAVQRSDRLALSEIGLNKPVQDDNGFTRYDAFIGRVGILEYARADGTMRREYRPPEEAFHADALESFRLMPVTNGHPREGLLTPENTRLHQVGTVDRPYRDGDKMRAAILITDAATIADVKAGKREMSAGYLCDVIEEPGITPDGEPYDALQTNIRANHVAIVDVGRAGPEIRLRADALEHVDDVARVDGYHLARAGCQADDHPELIRAQLEFRATLDSHFGESFDVRKSIHDDVEAQFRAALDSHFAPKR